MCTYPLAPRCPNRSRGRSSWTHPFPCQAEKQEAILLHGDHWSLSHCLWFNHRRSIKVNFLRSEWLKEHEKYPSDHWSVPRLTTQHLLATYRLLRGDLLPREEPGKDRSDAQDVSVDARVDRGVALVVRVEDPVEAAAGEGDLTLHEVDAELSRQGGVFLHGVPADVVLWRWFHWSSLADFDSGLSRTVDTV